MIPVTLVHHDREIYTEPHEFRPQRFLDAELAGAVWIPIGGGPRRCIAASLAQLEMQAVISTIMRLVRLAPADTRDEIPRTRGLTRPHHGGRVIVTETPAA